MKGWYFVIGYGERMLILPPVATREVVALTAHYDLFVGKFMARLIRV